jgi:hypothetical protein
MDPWVRNQILIILMVIIVGGSIGYTAAYLQFQPQIQVLWNQIHVLYRDLIPMHKILEYHGASDYVGSRQIIGNMIRLNLTVYGEHSESYIKVDLKYFNGTGYKTLGSSGTFFSGEYEIKIQEPGWYRISIETNDLLEYTIIIWDIY